jgi:hypothetical protein
LIKSFSLNLFSFLLGLYLFWIEEIIGSFALPPHRGSNAEGPYRFMDLAYLSYQTGLSSMSLSLSSLALIAQHRLLIQRSFLFDQASPIFLIASLQTLSQRGRSKNSRIVLSSIH